MTTILAVIVLKQYDEFLELPASTVRQKSLTNKGENDQEKKYYDWLDRHYVLDPMALILGTGNRITELEVSMSQMLVQFHSKS